MSVEVKPITTPRGEMPVHVYRPDEATAQQRIVVLYMDAIGIRPALHAHCERLSKAGYTAAMPDLWYDRDPAERPQQDRLFAGQQDEFARMATLVTTLQDDAIQQDTALMLDALRESATEPWGCIGFCMGGRFGLRAAQFLPGIAAASLLHPSRLVTDEEDSPHLGPEEITAAVYLGYGDADHITPVETASVVEAMLQRGAVDYQIDIFPGADHGFMMAGMRAYDEQAAERAWAETLTLFDERLKNDR